MSVICFWRLSCQFRNGIHYYYFLKLSVLCPLGNFCTSLWRLFTFSIWIYFSTSSICLCLHFDCNYSLQQISISINIIFIIIMIIIIMNKLYLCGYNFLWIITPVAFCLYFYRTKLYYFSCSTKGFSLGLDLIMCTFSDGLL